MDRPVLLLDAQATAASPARGALLEIGWARWSAGETRELPAGDVTAHVVAAPPGATVPPAVARVTGLRTPEWVRGVPPELAWGCLLREAARVAAPPVPVVVHFARFEEPFLRALHERHGAGPFPFELFCTHAVACRLLPELPRRTLRALAGYFGAAVPPLRRSADHVAATALVWRHLVALLAGREGIASLPELREWLERPARRCPRRFPLPPEIRRELPRGPGVYRLLRAGGSVLYVGKATSLRQRVGGHFHARSGERALEMLTQARDVSFTETATALEAALLEADEIKLLRPPFNVALTAEGRAVGFATADLRSVQEQPDAAHGVGPLVLPGPVESLAALRTVLSLDAAAPLPLRARAVGVEPAYAPGPTCFAEGLDEIRRRHGPLPGARDLLRLGGRLWAARRAGSPLAADRGDTAEPKAEATRRPAWDAERVAQALEETVVRAAHAVRRGRWLLRLSECSLAWTEPGTDRRRVLRIHRGSMAAGEDLEAGSPLPVPPGHVRTPAERRADVDLAAFDRLRVLTTELRGLAAGAGRVELRLGPHARLTRRRLQAVLRWV